MDPRSSSLDDIIKSKRKGQGKATLTDKQTDVVKFPVSGHASSSRWMNKTLDDIIHAKRLASFGLSETETTPMNEEPSSVPEASVPETQASDPEPEASVPEPNPLKSSLAEIISANKARAKRPAPVKRKLDVVEPEPVEEDDSEGKTHPLMQRRNHPSNSAYRAVSFLNKNGMIVEIKTGRRVSDKDRSHLWQVRVLYEKIEVVADSIRKKVAREMACDLFLKELRVTHPTVKIPRYVVFDEVFIDPKICDTVEKLSHAKGWDVTYEIRVKPLRADDVLNHGCYFLYVCTYYCGPEKYKGESVFVEYSKLNAAKAAVLYLSGRDVPATKYFVGNECNPADEYDYRETEIFQIVAWAKAEEDDDLDSI